LKGLIRLNVSELLKAAQEKGLETDTEIAAAIGVSATQFYRAKLPPKNPHYCSPGVAFIAGVLQAFGGPFERFFFLDCNITRSK